MRNACMAALLVACAACAPERHDTREESGTTMSTTPVLGLRSGIYHVADLDAAKRWYSELLGIPPYFDEPFYVGFDVGGYELGLNPDTSVVKPGAGGAMMYWGVHNADSALSRLLGLGASEIEPVTDVGGGVRHAIVQDPFGNLLGIIENPHFTGGR